MLTSSRNISTRQPTLAKASSPIFYPTGRTKTLAERNSFLWAFNLTRVGIRFGNSASGLPRVVRNPCLWGERANRLDKRNDILSAARSPTLYFQRSRGGSLGCADMVEPGKHVIEIGYREGMRGMLY